MMRIACFNVNSINARLENFIEWIKIANPDIVCLQELKCENHKFPMEAIEDLGYNCLINGQKSYNGVAIISKQQITLERDTIPNNEDDSQARYIEAIASLENNKALRIISVYCPNGNPLGTEKFDYKLQWMDKLKDHLQNLLEFEEDIIIAGDWNIIPRPEDCFDPKAWEEDALFHIESRKKWHSILNIGMTDSFMALDARPHQYTFWDYQGGAWAQDKGIHIDAILASPTAADCMKSYRIWRDAREEKKASDHVPVSVDFEF